LNPYFSAASTSDFIYIYGGQAVEGSTAKDYQKTETRLNIPRLDYSNGTCPSLLVEPQRTNLLTYSSSFSNAAWTKTNTTVSANASTSPSGIQDADKIIENTNNSTHAIFASASLGGTVDNSAYCISVFVKAEGRSKILFYDNNQNTSGATTFDLLNGTIVSGSGKIENYGNGYYRCTIFPIKNFSTTSNLQLYLLDSSGNSTYTGNGTSGIFIWGAQLEAGNYSTSYIPTTSASVTRNADVISKTGISSLIGQTEGTMFVDFYVDNLSAQTNDPVIFSFNTSNYIEIFADGRVNYYDGSGNIDINLPSYGLTNGRHKFGIAYNTNDVAFYIDGSLAGTDTSGTPSAKSDLLLGYTNLRFTPELRYNAVALWKTRLTNDELERLTGTGFNTYAEMANYYNYITQ
jgi:hypothetical protein